MLSTRTEPPTAATLPCLDMAEWMEEQLLSLLERFKGRLHEDDYIHVHEMLVHREWGIGLEDLCTQLYEHSTVVDAPELMIIEELAERMGLPPTTWNFLVGRTP